MALKLPEDAQKNGIVGNCGLVSMAVAAGVTVKEATAAYQKACVERRGKVMTGNWKGSTYPSIRLVAMKHLGLKLSRVNVKGMTLEKLCSYMQEDTRYVVTTTGHVQVVENGCVVDQSGVFSMSEYWGRRKKVKGVLIVEDKE